MGRSQPSGTATAVKSFFGEDGSEPLPEDAEYEPQSVEECVDATGETWRVHSGHRRSFALKL